MKTIQGNMIGSGLRFAIIASRFNELITSKLIEGAKDALTRHDVRHQDIDVFWHREPGNSLWLQKRSQ